MICQLPSRVRLQGVNSGQYQVGNCMRQDHSMLGGTERKEEKGRKWEGENMGLEGLC